MLERIGRWRALRGAGCRLRKSWPPGAPGWRRFVIIAVAGQLIRLRLAGAIWFRRGGPHAGVAHGASTKRGLDCLKFHLPLFQLRKARPSLMRGRGFRLSEISIW